MPGAMENEHILAVPLNRGTLGPEELERGGQRFRATMADEEYRR